MKITARAEPRYYIELTSEDAQLIRDLGLKSKDRSVSEGVEIASAWVTYIELLATEETNWTRMVNATHRQLEMIVKILAKAGPQPVERMTRINTIRTFFQDVMHQSSTHCRKFDLTFVSIPLLPDVQSRVE